MRRFKQEKHIVAGTGQFCIEVTKIINEFESQQMDYERPSNFFLVITGREKLWEQRHYELCYLKYLCVDSSGVDAKEDLLVSLVRKISQFAPTLPLSSYNVLVDEFRKLIVKVDKDKLIPQYFSKQENVSVDESKKLTDKNDRDELILQQPHSAQEEEKKYAVERKEHEKTKEHLSHLEEKLDEQVSVVKVLKDELDKKNKELEEKNAQIMQQTQKHIEEMQKTQEDMKKLEKKLEGLMEVLCTSQKQQNNSGEKTQNNSSSSNFFNNRKT